MTGRENARVRSTPLLLPALIGLVLAACSEAPVGPEAAPEPITHLPRELSVIERKIVARGNTFGLELFRRVHAKETAPNVFLSPLSASMALGMAMNGAAGETHQGMRKALGFEGVSEEEVNEAYRSLLDVLQDLDPAVEFVIANSIWSRLGFPVLPSFYETAAEYFDAEARELDFDDPSAVETINEWIREKTNGRIDEGLDGIGDEIMLFLINAIYFNGNWTQQFDPQRTRTAPFTRGDGSTVDVDMMMLDAPLRQTWTERYRAVELPYGGGAYSMVVVLPAPDVELAELVAQLNDDGWATLVAGLDSARLQLQLPKFRLEYDTFLNEPLVAMGMDSAFSAHADFSRLTPADVCIQFVRQKSFVEVDEEGTEAAAVTIIGFGVVSAPPSMIVDRPFLFAIRERFSGTILFIGAIGDPTQEDPPLPAKPAPPC